MGPIEQALRECDGDYGAMPYDWSWCRGVHELFWGAAEAHDLDEDCLMGHEVDADVFSYAIEAAEALGL